MKPYLLAKYFIVSVLLYKILNPFVTIIEFWSDQTGGTYGAWLQSIKLSFYTFGAAR